jgi:predicted nucleotidyltransferase
MGRMGGTADRLRERTRRRTEWIARATTQLSDDPDVAAAWLFGSEGRGDADELSDVDLIVAVVDDRAAARLADVESCFRDFGDVLAVDEPADRAMEGGRAFCVTYASPVEPLTVDWFWQPLSSAPMGSDVRVLVDRVGVRPVDPPVETATLLPGPIPGRGGTAPRRAARRSDRLQERVTWFWHMAPTLAKWLARGWTPTAESELQRLAHVVEEAHAFLGRQTAAQADGDRPPEAGTVRALARLRTAIVDLAALSDALVEAGISVPPTEVAYGWLELAEDLEHEQWRPELPQRRGAEGVP